jgi:probable F420-dependent oxidoreductase
MKFGLFSMNSFACSYPRAAVTIAQLAEAVGFESVWAGEHVVLPDPQVAPSPAAPDDRFLDPIVALTYLAAHTHQLRLGTGIVILPQRNPLVLAKELASLDEISDGRLIFGIGTGYLEPEFRALGIPFADRGVRTDDYLAAMRAIWTQEKPVYHGRFVSFENVRAYPQRSTIPVVVGGHSESAYRRTVQQGNGWYGWMLDPDAAAHALVDIAEALKRYERPQELGTLEISVTPPSGKITLDDAKRYADLGVDRLILLPRRTFRETDLKEFVSQLGEAVVSRF